MLSETITPKIIPSRSAIIENVFFGDGYYTFGLKIDQLKRLQEITGVGIMALYNRIIRQEWMIDDIFETVRLGLIGGGNDPKLAYDVTKATIKEGHITDYIPLALLIIQVLLTGVPDEPTAEDEDEAELDAAEAESEDVKKKD